MIDLHLHLDGSLSKEDYIELAKFQGIQLEEDFYKKISVSPDCKSLEEYLEKFELPLKLMQDPLAIAFATKRLVCRLAQMGYLYVEIRFAPLLHCRKGLSQTDVVLSAIRGLKDGLLLNPDFDANLILCCMRQASEKENMETIKLADEFRNDKIVAVDMAGPEGFKTGDNYTTLFDEAERRKLNITIHAGEACGSDEVIRAIDLLHAKRIGHGVHLDVTRENAMKMLMNNIGFEFCPTSNLQTKSLASYTDVPLSDFLKYGIMVCINSDNITVSNTNVFNEFSKLYQTFHLTLYEAQLLLKNAANMAFIDTNQRLKLIFKINERINSFYQIISK